MAQKVGKPDRNHNSHAVTCCLAGDGVRGGVSYSATDEIGHKAVDDRVSVHNLHASILHLLEFDHERWTFRHNGRDFRLTNVDGRVVRKIIT